ncbi:hypothetical protein D0T60_01345 [Bacteroides sp. 224]|nr:hypothetical protein [Bacteroides sp. 224]
MIKQTKVLGHLVHEATKTKIAVYKPINRFRRLMIKWCFGFRYETVESILTKNDGNNKSQN